MLYVVQLVGSGRVSKSRGYLSIKVMQLDDKLFSRVNIIILPTKLRYFLLRDGPKLYI